MTLSLRTKLVAMFLISIVGLLFFSWNLRHLVAQNEEDLQWANHTRDVLEALGRTLIRMLDIETGQRGYVITGDKKFLEPANAAISSAFGINRHFQILRELSSDNPNQHRPFILMLTRREPL